jgi:hypothetical protein
MSAVIHDSPFLRRFDSLWARIRRVQLGQAIVLSGLAVVLAFAGLMAADYWLELSWNLRAASLVMAACLVVVWAGMLLMRFLAAGAKPATAAQVERAFPQLGQSVRTTVQYGQATHEQVAAAGIRDALISALEDDTHARSRSLHLDSIVPSKRLTLASVALAACAITLVAMIGASWEWRTAASRALLGQSVYTDVSLKPGNLKVDQGAPVELTVAVTGRTDRETKLLTRLVGQSDTDWVERQFVAEDAVKAPSGELSFVTRLESVKHPVEYKAIAGPAESPIHRIDVRYPLTLKKVEVELTPPEYTNHPPKKSEDPNVTVVEGTLAAFEILVDQPPRTASLVFTDLSAPKGEEPAEGPQTVPLQIAGTKLTASLPLIRDMKYSIVAETGEGQRLPDNSYRVRVRPDQAPEVTFEEPRDTIDVHTLAEVLMRIRVRDDFGISKAGIIFEVNNEEEYPLLQEDFATAAEELKTLGKLTPDTQAALEKVLPLEFFQLKMTDSVAYYAFAEDNFPGTPHRSTTDLRFVDIRPFRIRYSLRDDPDGNGESMPGPKIATLEELIKRQRFNLNRSMNMERRVERKEKIDLTLVDGVVTSEMEIAQATRQLADFLGGLMVDDLADEIQLLLQAEAHMLAASDSLSAAKFDTAVLQQRDALKELIEGRNRLREEITKNPAKFRSLGAADRRMAQKLRRPKSDKEEAEEVVRRLKQLAAKQEEIQSGVMPSDEPSDEGAAGGEKPDPMKDEETKTAKSGDATKPVDDAPMPGEKPAADANEAAVSAKPDAKSGEAGDEPGPSGDDAAKPQKSPAQMREELKDKQLDNVLEAQDVEKALGKLKNITDLAKERMTAANKSLEGANSSLDRGDDPGVVKNSDEAIGALNDLAKQVEALIKEEAAERLDEARKLANELAESQAELAANIPSMNQGQSGKPNDKDPMDAQAQKKGAGEKGDDPQDKSDDPMQGEGDKPGEPKEDPKDPMSGAGEKPMSGGKSGSGDPISEQNDPMKGGGGGPGDKDSENKEGAGKTDALAKQAEENAETGKSIRDILNSILKSNDPADREVIAKVEGIMKDSNLDETVKRMEAIGSQLRDGRTDDARIGAQDSADRWEITAGRLGAAFREVSAPKLEELMDIERRLAELRERMENLKSERDVTKFLADAGKLLQRLEEMKVGAGVREELQKLMEKAGWTEDAEQFRLNKESGWAISDETRLMSAPEGYAIAIRDVSQAVQAHIQELILGDVLSTQGEVTPPQYEKLVERYYQVLARQKRPEMKAETPPPKAEDK